MMREERKVITVVSTDLVGSTTLGERLDPEEVKLIVGEVIASTVRTIEELGGTVKDLAGDGVLALFGAPVAHEDDAERAFLKPRVEGWWEFGKSCPSFADLVVSPVSGRAGYKASQR